MSSYSRGFHFAINCWQFIVVCHLVPGPTPCPEVVAVFYIRPAEVPTVFSVEGDTQVERQNTVVGFLTQVVGCRLDERNFARVPELSEDVGNVWDDEAARRGL